MFSVDTTDTNSPDWSPKQFPYADSNVTPFCKQKTASLKTAVSMVKNTFLVSE
jgi:hypothetical protein